MISMVLNDIVGDCTIELTIHVEPLWCTTTKQSQRDDKFRRLNVVLKGPLSWVDHLSHRHRQICNHPPQKHTRHWTNVPLVLICCNPAKWGQTWAARPQFSSFFQTTDYLATDWVMLGTSRTEVPWLKQVWQTPSGAKAPVHSSLLVDEIHISWPDMEQNTWSNITNSWFLLNLPMLTK